MFHTILDRPIAYHRILAEVAGSVGGGVFLSQALYWSKRTTLPDGWFYKTAEQWWEETYLTRREQETIRKRLVALKVLEEQKRGVPAKLHFRLNVNVLDGILGNIQKHHETSRNILTQEDVQTSMAENAKLDSTNPPNLIGGKRQTNTETTSEITTEIKNIYPDSDFDEFWAAYPKRPSNPKAEAKKKYMLARKRGVSRETLLTAVNKYAESRSGEDPKFTAQACTWLNQRRWEDDDDPVLPNVNISTIIDVYPVKITDVEAAKQAVAMEVMRGSTVDEIRECAVKYAKHIKELRADGLDAPVTTMENWLRWGKWKEMKNYELVRVGPDRRLTIRQVKK